MVLKHPSVYDIDKDENAIVMEKIEGILVKEIFENLNDSKIQICQLIIYVKR